MEGARLLPCDQIVRLMTLCMTAGSNDHGETAAPRPTWAQQGEALKWKWDSVQNDPDELDIEFPGGKDEYVCLRV